jgi:hypothetical protein
MKQAKTFARAFAESIRLEIPYWVCVMALLSARVALDFAWLDIFITVLLAYVGIGSCVVFVMLKQPSRQDTRRIDFLGALQNVYHAAWWPLYAWERITSKR